MSHILAAAAVPLLAMVRVPEHIPSAQTEFIITHISNGTPRPGRLVWEDEDGLEVEIGGATRVAVLSFP